MNIHEASGVARNRMTGHLLRLCFLIVLLAPVSGCALLSGGGFNLISLDEEWEMGRAIEAELNQQLTLVNDARTQQYIGQIGRRIVAQTDLSDRPWSFHVVADGAVNAFNTPGGNVYINTGLIEAADNVAELAGVMAHEIAHGVARHATQQMSTQYGINVAASILLGSEPGLVEQIATQIAAGGAMASFSREDEREADRLGVRYMHRAGYHPDGLASFFEKLLDREQRQPGALSQFFSTHPLTSERVAAARREAQRLRDSQHLITNDNQLASIQQRVRGHSAR